MMIPSSEMMSRLYYSQSSAGSQATRSSPGAVVPPSLSSSTFSATGGFGPTSPYAQNWNTMLMVTSISCIGSAILLHSIASIREDRLDCASAFKRLKNDKSITKDQRNKIATKVSYKDYDDAFPQFASAFKSQLQKKQTLECPISIEPMEEPVVDIYGHSYNRTNIEDWVNVNHTSPATRENLALKDLRKDYGLIAIILNEYKKVLERGMDRSELSESEGTNMENVIKDIHSNIIALYKIEKTMAREQLNRLNKEQPEKEKEWIEIYKRRRAFIKNELKLKKEEKATADSTSRVSMPTQESEVDLHTNSTPTQAQFKSTTAEEDLYQNSPVSRFEDTDEDLYS